jgi:hypothetical protein
MQVTMEDRAIAQVEREKSKRKMTSGAIAKMRLAIEAKQHQIEAERVFIEMFERIVALNWRQDSPPSDFWPLRQVLERISRPVNETEMTRGQVDRYYDRRTLKLQHSLANGWKPKFVHDVAFLAELTPEEWALSDEAFYAAMTENWPEAKREDANETEQHMWTATCVVCGGHFPAQRRDAKYCKPGCRNRASYQRGRRGNPRSRLGIDTLSLNQHLQVIDNQLVPDAVVATELHGGLTGHTSAI